MSHPFPFMNTSLEFQSCGLAGLLIVSSGLRTNLGCFLAALKESSCRSILTFAELQKSMLTPKASGNRFCCHLDAREEMVLGKPPGSLSSMPRQPAEHKQRLQSHSLPTLRVCSALWVLVT